MPCVPLGLECSSMPNQLELVSALPSWKDGHGSRDYVYLIAKVLKCVCICSISRAAALSRGLSKCARQKLQEFR